MGIYRYNMQLLIIGIRLGWGANGDCLMVKCLGCIVCPNIVSMSIYILRDSMSTEGSHVGVMLYEDLLLNLL